MLPFKQMVYLADRLLKGEPITITRLRRPFKACLSVRFLSDFLRNCTGFLKAFSRTFARLSPNDAKLNSKLLQTCSFSACMMNFSGSFISLQYRVQHARKPVCQILFPQRNKPLGSLDTHKHHARLAQSAQMMGQGRFGNRNIKGVAGAFAVFADLSNNI